MSNKGSRSREIFPRKDISGNRRLNIVNTGLQDPSLVMGRPVCVSDMALMMVRSEFDLGELSFDAMVVEQPGREVKSKPPVSVVEATRLILKASQVTL